MIPETKQEAVAHALRSAFGVDEIDEISAMTAGLSSALVFRIVVLGEPYLLRIITRTDAMADPTRQFACMRLAEEAGLAPRIRYLSVEERISITDFIEAVPLSMEEACMKLPPLLRRLHALPKFPQPLNYFATLDGFMGKLRDANFLPDDMARDVFDAYAKILSIYPRGADELVSCHNDLKPENILFDGERVWLVDWEAAFLNDRYADLAVVANFLLSREDEDAEFLDDYFGEPVGEYDRARFFLMRQMMHMFYLAVFMLLGAAARSAVDPYADVPDFREFHVKLWSGAVDLRSEESKVRYAWVHGKRLLRALRSERFADALRVVSRHRSTPPPVGRV